MAVAEMSNWILVELLRIFHAIPISEAQKLADSLVDRRYPIIWEDGAIKRILNPKIKASDQVLMLLYGEIAFIDCEILRTWIEYKDKSKFTKIILFKLHSARLIELDRQKNIVKITSLGLKNVEDRKLLYV